MQTVVQKTESVRFGSWVIEGNNGAGWVNLGMASDIVLDITQITKQFIWANAKMPPKSNISEAKLNFNHYEFDMTFLNLISWNFDYSVVAGTLVNIVWEALWTGWTVDTPIALANKNWDDSEVASIVIDADGSPLVLNTDYSVYVYLWVTFILPITAQTGVLDADYDYTPNASKTAEFGDSDRSLSLNQFRFVNTNENGEKFTIEFYKAYNAEGITLNFQWDDDEDPASYPVSLTAFEDDTKVANKNLFRIIDEQSKA